MIEVRLSPSGRQLELHLGDHRGQMTWRDVNDRIVPLLQGASPTAFLVVAPRMMRARDFADMLQALPAVREALSSIARVAILSDTPPVDWLAQLRQIFEGQELRHFLPAEQRRAERWLDAAPAKAADSGAGAGINPDTGTQDSTDSGDGVYHLDEQEDDDSDIDDWFVKS